MGSFIVCKHYNEDKKAQNRAAKISEPKNLQDFRHGKIEFVEFHIKFRQ